MDNKKQPACAWLSISDATYAVARICCRPPSGTWIEGDCDRRPKSIISPEPLRSGTSELAASAKSARRSTWICSLTRSFRFLRSRMASEFGWRAFCSAVICASKLRCCSCKVVRSAARGWDFAFLLWFPMWVLSIYLVTATRLHIHI